MSKSKFFETDSFKQTKDEWYEKLKADGFTDIEEGESEGLVQPQIFKVGRGVDYYQFCQSVLREYPFKRDIDRAIFELHAEGKTVREIETIIKEKSYKALGKSQINDIIYRTKENFLKMKT